MAWTDGVDYSTGQLISASIWNNYLGAAGNIDLTAPGVVTTAGDTTYATGDNTLSRLAKGTARQTLAMNSGATAPEWAASSRSVLTTVGDVMYASGTNTPARLAKGTARQNLTINSGATAPEWTASAASLMTAKADVLSTSAANTPARLAVGSNDQVLTAASGESTGLKWADAAGGMTVASQWRLTVDFDGAVNPIASNWEEVDAPVGFGVLGSSMTESSGLFTFPSTGYYWIQAHGEFYYNGATQYQYMAIRTTTDDGTYASATNPGQGSSTDASDFFQCDSSYIFDVTSTSTHKVAFKIGADAAGVTTTGSTSTNETHVTFLRLGDT
jgi:hypothetical protein